MAFQLKAKGVTEFEKMRAGDKTIPVLRWRETGSSKVYEGEFASYGEMQAFVNQHRAVCAFDEAGNVIPNKLQQVGKWDWFVQMTVWERDGARITEADVHRERQKVFG